MSVYQAGRGLDRRSVQRLQQRKGASQDVLKEMPAEDQSKQWEGLIGSGKKKLRCSACTRPIDPDHPTARQLLCELCSTAGAQLDPPEKDQRHRGSLDLDCVDECGQAPELCRTPSTEANSEELAVVSQPPTPHDVDWASLKRQLAGEWLGPRGSQYQVVFGDLHDMHVTCTNKERSVQPDVPLFLDIQERHVWWSKDRLYFLDLSEVDWASAQLANIVWRSCDSGSRGGRPDMEWKRPPTRGTGNKIRAQRWAPRVSAQDDSEPLTREPVAAVETPAPQASATEIDEKVSTQVPESHPASAQEAAKPQKPKAPTSCAVWKPVARTKPVEEAQAKASGNIHDKAVDKKEELAAAALREIIGQLKRPGNGGYVWVDDWNERFNATLGTVRSFIESRPDKFKVTPTSGRGYRVMLVSEIAPSKPTWRKVQN